MTETPKDLAHEAEEGKTARTPAIALTGVTLAVTILVAVILIVASVVYELSQ